MLRYLTTLLVDALRETYELSELFVDLGFARSSYFYHRARLRGALRDNGFTDLRLVDYGW